MGVVVLVNNQRADENLCDVTEMLTDEVIFQSLKLTFADFLLYSDLSCDFSQEDIVTGRPHETHTIITSPIFFGQLCFTLLSLMMCLYNCLH